MPPLPHPWRRLRDLTHITVNWHVGGPMGKCKHSTQEISIRSDLTQAQRRAVVLHELEHLAEGPAVRGYEAHDEKIIRERAARWLISMDDLAGALAEAYDDEEVADLLWVDITTVQTRLTTLTDAESAELNRRLDEAELTCPKT